MSRLRLNMSATTGVFTSFWSLGQASRPALVALFLKTIRHVDTAFALSLPIAAAVLGLGALVFLLATRVWPDRSSVRSTGPAS